MMTVAIAPHWKSIVPERWVGISTGRTVPLSGSLVTVRVGKVIRVEPLTLRAGPIRLIRAVR